MKKIYLILFFAIITFVLFRQYFKPENTVRPNLPNSKYKTENKVETATSSQKNVPIKAYEIRDYVKKYKRNKIGFVGGRVFKNLEKRLPKIDKNGNKIKYQEWDINEHFKGKNRGSERLITGSNGTDYYTNDHYKSFIALENKSEK